MTVYVGKATKSIKRNAREEMLRVLSEGAPVIRNHLHSSWQEYFHQCIDQNEEDFTAPRDRLTKYMQPTLPNVGWWCKVKADLGVSTVNIKCSKAAQERRKQEAEDIANAEQIDSATYNELAMKEATMGKDNALSRQEKMRMKRFIFESLHGQLESAEMYTAWTGFGREEQQRRFAALMSCSDWPQWHACETGMAQHRSCAFVNHEETEERGLGKLRDWVSAWQRRTEVQPTSTRMDTFAKQGVRFLRIISHDTRFPLCPKWEEAAGHGGSHNDSDDANFVQRSMEWHKSKFPFILDDHFSIDPVVLAVEAHRILRQVFEGDMQGLLSWFPNSDLQLKKARAYWSQIKPLWTSVFNTTFRHILSPARNRQGMTLQRHVVEVLNSLECGPLLLEVGKFLAELGKTFVAKVLGIKLVGRKSKYKNLEHLHKKELAITTYTLFDLEGGNGATNGGNSTGQLVDFAVINRASIRHMAARWLQKGLFDGSNSIDLRQPMTL